MDVRGPNDCWEWGAGKGTGGHGVFSCYRNGRKINRSAHVYSWELVNGPMPDGLHGCHTCDNPGCVNPAHTFPGTNKDNHVDAAIKGRKAKKLTNEQVREIVESLDGTRGEQTRLAEIYGVSQSMISFIARGKRREAIQSHWLSGR